MSDHADEKVVYLHETTNSDIPPDRVLEAAIGKLDIVFLAGINKETGNVYFASSTANCQQLLWLTENAKKIILSD